MNHLKIKESCKKKNKLKKKKKSKICYPVALGVGAHGVLRGQSDAASHDHKKNSHLEVA